MYVASILGVRVLVRGLCMIRSVVGCVFSQKKLLMDAVMDAAGVLEEPVYLLQHALLHCSCRVQRCKLASGLWVAFGNNLHSSCLLFARRQVLFCSIGPMSFVAISDGMLLVAQCCFSTCFWLIVRTLCSLCVLGQALSCLLLEDFRQGARFAPARRRACLS